VFVVTCMDERNAFADEALGLGPGAARIYASGGGRIDVPTFKAAFGAALSEASSRGEAATVFLLPHECSHDPGLGCAAFSNDTDAQREFFTALRSELKAAFPGAFVHVLSMCTTTHRLRPIAADEGDARLADALAANAALDLRAQDAAHAGHGIYVGDAYRAWVPARNAYFRLSALNPAIKDNAKIALAVMRHHSEVDLSSTPIVLHVDHPRYDDADRTAAAARNIDAHVAALLADPEVLPLATNGAFRIVRTATDMGTWAGAVLE
jgi:hypothetical protein